MLDVSLSDIGIIILCWVATCLALLCSFRFFVDHGSDNVSLKKKKKCVKLYTIFIKSKGFDNDFIFKNKFHPCIYISNDVQDQKMIIITIMDVHLPANNT